MSKMSWHSTEQLLRDFSQEQSSALTTDTGIPKTTLYYYSQTNFCDAWQKNHCFFLHQELLASVTCSVVCQYCLDKMHKLGQVLCFYHKDESCLQSKSPRETIMKTCKCSKIFSWPCRRKYLLIDLTIDVSEGKLLPRRCVTEKVCMQAQRCDQTPARPRGDVWDSVITSKLSWC